MPRLADLAARLAEVRQRIAACGRDPAEVTIVAVTKGRSLEECRSALDAGIRILGENRIQEGVPKAEQLTGAEWHFIGHLQSNKVRHAVRHFALIQSVDSVELAEEIARRNERQRVLLEVNVARQWQRYGVLAEDAVETARKVAALLPLEGVMAMGPANEDPAPAFQQAARVLKECEQALGRSLTTLSMGMSGDFETAVACGSTMVRLGRLLFDP